MSYKKKVEKKIVPDETRHYLKRKEIENHICYLKTIFDDDHPVLKRWYVKLNQVKKDD